MKINFFLPCRQLVQIVFFNILEGISGAKQALIVSAHFYLGTQTYHSYKNTDNQGLMEE